MKAILMEECNRAALQMAAALGAELRYSLVRYEGRSAHGRGARMIFSRDSGSPRVVVEVYPEVRKVPRSLLMYVEMVPRGALPNRFKFDASIGGMLIKGKNRCFNVEPREDKTSFNVRACVIHQVEHEMVVQFNKDKERGMR